ncbi:hypothetical protein HanLR1_Chr01g0011021 [Helianthus annuus]|nr:hypothetical protein HanLR1_Chr01g0011021 [Helianthus annuus]
MFLADISRITQDRSKIVSSLVFFFFFTMGKGKGKAKKSSTIAHREDRSGEEEKPPVKRRGRPTKSHKEEEESEKINEKNDTKLENKRKSPSLETEESLDMLKDENGMVPEANGVELTKAVGFRHNGSRRKNKPRRAAEVGVSACEVCSWLVIS